MHLHISLKQCNSIHCGKFWVSLCLNHQHAFEMTITNAKTKWKRFYCLKYMNVCVCVCVYIYNWHIINFADNLHYWFGEGLCQWQLPESQFHKMVYITDVFTVQLVQFFVIFINTSHPDISSSDRLFSQVYCAAHTKNHSYISSL